MKQRGAPSQYGGDGVEVCGGPTERPTLACMPTQYGTSPLSASLRPLDLLSDDKDRTNAANRRPNAMPTTSTSLPPFLLPPGME